METQMQLEITIDLSKYTELTEEELQSAGYENSLDYWLDLLYADPPLMLDGALINLTTSNGSS
jgi:hypothetical protein